jgi:hypothetical protein
LRKAQGLDPNDSLSYGGYTLQVGQGFRMPRGIVGTGKGYLSEGKIIGFAGNGAIVVIERNSLSKGKTIESYITLEFVEMIENGKVIGISKDPNPAELISEEIAARQDDQRRINEIMGSIRNKGDAEAGVETTRIKAAEIYDNTKGIKIYSTPDGKAIAFYTSQYTRERQEDRAVV